LPLSDGMSFRSAHVIGYSPQPSLADFLKRLLEGAGFTATACWSPQDLDRDLVKHQALAVVYEIGFPFKENWNNLQQVRLRQPLTDVPFVIVTAEPDELYRRVGARADLTLFAKPSDPRELRDVVATATAAARHRARASRQSNDLSGLKRPA
jgi:DNA-binding response OmpR family regulator